MEGEIERALDDLRAQHYKPSGGKKAKSKPPLPRTRLEAEAQAVWQWLVRRCKVWVLYAPPAGGRGAPEQYRVEKEEAWLTGDEFADNAPNAGRRRVVWETGLVQEYNERGELVT